MKPPMTDHLITSPSELTQEWIANTFRYNLKEKLIEAARWGTDQEPEA